jgi:hypothetical protein
MGSWKEDKFNGDGLYLYAHGEKYQGKFVDGKKTGRGLIIIKVGLSFKVNGKKIRKMASVYFSILITKNIKEIG